jgi:hypothetical protein
MLIGAVMAPAPIELLTGSAEVLPRRVGADAGKESLAC